MILFLLILFDDIWRKWRSRLTQDTLHQFRLILSLEARDDEYFQNYNIFIYGKSLHLDVFASTELKRY